MADNENLQDRLYESAKADGKDVEKVDIPSIGFSGVVIRHESKPETPNIPSMRDIQEALYRDPYNAFLR